MSQLTTDKNQTITNMKRIILCSFMLTMYTGIGVAQEADSVLVAPENWIGEIIPFPLGFAREIDFVGYEDLRFAPKWSDSTSQEFWTYAFVWYIEKQDAMTVAKLEENFNLYYDGLMGVNDSHRSDSNQSTKLNKTQSVFKKSASGFTGEMTVYDRFFTKDYITLNVQVSETFCLKTNKQIIRCDISPKEFSNSVWNIFEQVSVNYDCK